MADENTNVQENIADSQNSISVNAVDTGKNTAQDAESSQIIEQNAEQTPENASREVVDAPDEANTGTKVREYETPNLHEGVTRLGRLDQAYPDDEREREDLQGAPDGPINQPPYFPLGAFDNPDAPDGLEAKEAGVADGGNTPEAGNDTVKGTVTAIDPEGGPVQYFFRTEFGGQTQELELTHGTITLDRLTGEFVYTLNNEDADTDGLNQGERVTDEVQIYAVDEEGLEGSNTLPVTISIEGTNDVPTLTVESGQDNPLTVHEDETFGDAAGTLTDNGAAVGADVDTEAVLTYGLLQDETTGATVLNQDGTYGTLTIDPDTGTYIYNLTNGANGEAGPVQSLAEGEEGYDTFTVRVQDEHGAWADTPVFVKVIGTNDAPTVDMSAGETDLSDVVLIEHGVRVGGNTEEVGKQTASGVIQGTDIDSDNLNGKDLVYTLQGGQLVTDTVTGEVFSTLSTDYGELRLNTVTGAYTYTLDDSGDVNNIVNKMKQGSTVPQDFTFVITDEHDATVTQNIQFTIQGTNDRPTLTVDTEPLAVTEDGTQEDSAVAVGADVDTAAVLKYTLMDGGTAKLSHKGTYGTLSIDPESGKYTYTLDNRTNGEAGLVQNLAKDEEVYDNFTVRVQDEHGSWSDAPVTVNITGTNDAPTVNMRKTAMVDKTLKEAGVKDGGNEIEKGDTKANGVIQGTDIDSDNLNGKDLVYTIQGGQLVTDAMTDEVFSTLSTDYGELRLNTVTGAYTYTLDDSGDADNIVNKMKQGSTVPQDFTFIITDAHKATVTQDITFTIQGTNDRPTLTVDTEPLAVTEDGMQEDSAVAVGADVDTAAVLKYTLMDGGTAKLSHKGTYGTLTIDPELGKYTYKLDNGTNGEAGPVQNLAEGEGASETFMVRVYDEHGSWSDAPVTVNITGTNDAPTIDKSSTLTLKDQGKVTDLRVDNDNKTPNKDTVNSELAPDLSTETPVNGTTHTLTGTVSTNGADIDNNRVLKYTLKSSDSGVEVKNNSVSTDYGTMTLDATTGKYTYTLKTQEGGPVDRMQEDEWYHEYYTVDVTDEHGLTASHAVTIDIEGTNDAPTLEIEVDDKFKTVIESGVVDKDDGAANLDQGNSEVKGQLYAKGQLAGSDVDTNGSTPRYGIIVNGKHVFPDEHDDDSYSIETWEGKMTLHADGSYVFKLNDEEYKYLNEGALAFPSFTFVVYDEHGAWATQKLTIRVEGTNDQPNLTVESALAVSDTDSGFIAKEFAQSSDVDIQDVKTHRFSLNIEEKKVTELTEITSVGGYGTVRVDEKTGEYEYILDRTNAAVKALHANKTLQDSFVVYVKDEHGATASQLVNVTITGAEDAPVFAEEGNFATVVETGVEVVNGRAANGTQRPVDGTLLYEGSIRATDADDGDTNQIKYGIVDSNAYTLNAANSTYTSAITEDTHTITTDNGVFVLYTKTGKYTYTLTQGSDTIQSLLPGQSLVETFIVKATDPSLLSDTMAILVTTLGTNDAPVIDVANSNVEVLTNEDVSAPLIGTIVATDVDHADGELKYSLFQEGEGGAKNRLVQTMQGDYGYIDVNPTTGQYQYFLDSSKVQSLRKDQSAQETFTVRAVDDLYAHDDITVTITIEGRDDEPTVSAELVPIKEDAGEVIHSSTNNPVVIGEMEATDIDDGEEPKFSLFDEATNSLLDEFTGKYGTITLSDNGSYTYTLTKNASDEVQTLNVGGTLTDTFKVQVESGGVVKDTTLTVTIEGTNDAPVLTGGLLGTVMENNSAIVLRPPTNVNNSNYVGAVDIDNGAELKQYFMAKFDTTKNDYVAAAVGDDGKFAEGTAMLTTMRGDYGMLEINGDGSYTYTVDQHNPTVSKLGKKDSLEDTFKLTVMDEHGATDTKEFSVIIKGIEGSTKIGAKITNVDAVDVTENGDSDGNGATWSTATGVITLEKDGGKIASTPLYLKTAAGPVSSIVDEYGTLTLSRGSGNKAYYTYTLHEGVDAVESLYKGQQVDLSYTVCTIKGNKKESSGQIDITIVGTNDAPKLEPATYEETISETAEVRSLSGQVIATDVDNREGGAVGEKELLAYSFATTEGVETDGNFAKLTTEYGTMKLDTTNGEYTYTLNDTFADLPLGSDETESFDIVVTDGKAPVMANVTVTIKAENAAPKVTLIPTPLEVTEDVVIAGHVEASGTPFVEDPDADESFTYAIADDEGKNSATVVYGTYGSLILNKSTGDYRYVLDTMSEAVQTLGEGQSKTETFTYTVKDAHGGETTETFDVLINGANDAPVVTVDKMNLFVKETGTPDEVAQSGEASAVDIDANNTGFVYSLRFGEGATAKTIEGGSEKLATMYGTMTLTDTGEYTYTVDPTLAAGLAQGETVVERVTLLVQDVYAGSGGVETLGAPVEHEILISLTGTNTAPELDLRPKIAISDVRDEIMSTLTTEGLTENDASYIFSGDISGNVTDADSKLTDLRYSINTADDPNTAPLASQLVQSLQGEHGILRLDTVSGEYTYTMDKAYVASLGVAGNTTESETFTIVARDEYGAIDQQQITMEITGVNDALTMESEWDAVSVTQGEGPSPYVRIDVDDVDKDDSFAFGIRYGEDAEASPIMATAASYGDVRVACSYGTFFMNRGGEYGGAEFGSYRFEIDNTKKAVQELGQGESVTEKFWVLAEDSGDNVVEHLVEVTINGANDDPMFDTTQSSTVQYDEDSSQVKGELVAVDIDKNDKLTFSLMDDDGDKVDALLELVYGSVAVEDDGSYTYTLKAGVDVENGVSDSFTVDVFDKYGGVDTATVMVEVNSLTDDVGVQKVMAEVTVQA